MLDLGRRPYSRLGKFVEAAENWTPACCEELLAWCEEVRIEDPPHAVEAALAGVKLAAKVEPDAAGSVETDTAPALRARALGVLASAYRVACRFDDAERTLALALGLESLGALPYADLCRRMMYLRMDQRRFVEASGHVDTAIEIYRRLDTPHLLGCALVDRGVLRGTSGEIQGSIADLQASLNLIDVKAGERYFSAAIHNLAVSLEADEESDPAELAEYLRRAKRLNKFPPKSLSSIKLLWLQGRVYKRLGEIDRAEQALGTAIYRLASIHAPYEAALIGLELVMLYRGENRWPEAKEIAAEIYEIFRAVENDRESVAALALLREAVQGEIVDRALFLETVDVLREHAVRIPVLSFDSG